MKWLFEPYALIYLATAAGSSAVAVYAWRRSAVPGARTLGWLMVAGAEWALAVALEIAAVGVQAKFFWSKVEYVGLLAVPVLFFWLALEYTNPGRRRPRWLWWLLWVVPVGILLLAITNERHGLLWTSITPSPAGHNLYVYGHGAGFLVNVIYSYGLVVIAAFLLVRAALSLPHLFRGQVIALLIAAGAPLAGNVLYLSKVNPAPGLDLSPVGFVFSGLALAWGVLRYRLFDLAPYAREAVFENIADGVLVVDDLGRVADANVAAEKMLSLSSSSFIGHPIEKALANWPPPAIAAVSEVLAKTDTTARQQTEVCLSLRPPLFLGVGVTRLDDQDRGPGGRLVILHDITDARVAQEALQRSNVQLWESNQELDAFAHTVAHDLKGQLTVIGGYAEITVELCDDSTPAEIREYLNEILRGTDRMARVLNGLILLARTRREEVVLGKVDMGGSVACALESLATEIRKQAAVVIVPDTWPAAMGYGPWVDEVWLNYLSNAVKYGGRPDLTPPAAPRIEAGSTLQEDRQVRFWVRDNGPGIPPEDYPRLFVPFSRLGQAGTTGHGLGLSIVQRIVERLGGQVGVESVVGQGSTFYFTLPQAPLD